MRKNIIVGLFILSLIFAVKPAAAHHIDDAFFVKTIGSFAAFTDFDISETPILYVKASHPGSVFLNSAWFGNTNNTLSNLFDPSGSDLDHWLTPQNWASVKEIGAWDVQIAAFFPAPNNEIDNRLASFNVTSTVTPEPISTALFLAGGAPLAYGLLRKRKKA